MKQKTVPAGQNPTEHTNSSDLYRKILISFRPATPSFPFSSAAKAGKRAVFPLFSHITLQGQRTASQTKFSDDLMEKYISSNLMRSKQMEEILSD